MADDIRFKRGNAADRPTLLEGEPSLDTDAEKAWLGAPSGNLQFQFSPPTSALTLYAATSTFGGDTAANGRTGFSVESGTATSTTASALIDTAATFTTAMVGLSVYNSTDDTWAKVDAFVSSTQLTLSVDIMVSGEAYVVCSSIDNNTDVFNEVPTGFLSNITIQMSDGSFTDSVTWIGKTAGGAFTLTIQGSTSGTTTIAGEVTQRQRIFLRNLTHTKRVFQLTGADIDWTTCVTSGDDGFILRKSDNVTNIFRTTSVIVFESDPGIFTNIASTVTIGYSFYVGTSTVGGSDTTSDGLLITQGSATSTTSNKLVDSTANFNATDHLNKTLFNTTDETWAKITAIDSTTQVSISANIMVSGETYEIVSAYATYQVLHDDAIPGTINADTDVQFSNETHSSAHVTQGKGFSGAYTLKLLGSKTADVALTSVTSATQGGTGAHGTLTKTGAGWTVDEHKGKWVFDTTNSKYNLIQSNTATVLTIVGVFTATPAANFAVYSSTTTFSGAQTVQEGQLSTQYEFVTWSVAGETWIDIKANSFLRFLYCDILGYRATGGSEVEASYTYIHGEKSRLAWAQILSRHNVPRCLIESTGAGATVCIQTDSDAYVGCRDTTFVVDGTSTNTTGIYVSLNSSAIFFIAGTKADLKNNVTYGLRCETGGQAAFTSTTYFVFSGNGTDRSADAPSFAFFS